MHKNILVIFLYCFSFVFSGRLDNIKWHVEYLDEDGNVIQEGKSLPINDFEDGRLGVWNDESAADARWAFEAIDSPIDPTQPAPIPLQGSKYLRVNRPAGTSGQAVLRSSTFTVEPGDQFSMNFWIRSQIIQTNNLEVYWTNGASQERILSLVQYSTPANFEWRPITALIPATETMQTRLSIFGFCNTGDVDAVAIDDLGVIASNETPPTQQTTTAGPDQTTVSSTQTTPTTTQSSGNCPSSFGPNPMKCAVLGGKCYCFSLDKVSSWSVGDTYCRTNGATLVNLETQAETALIDDYISGTISGLDKNAYWTSGQYQSSGYFWTGSNQAFTYTNWYPGEPNDNANGYCVRLFYGTDFSGRWSDIICTGEGYTPFYFICEL